MLYGLRQSPRHWYDKINAILISIGLKPSLEDPCLYSGLFRILLTLHRQNLLHLLPLASMSMTLCTSQKTLPSKLSSAVCWPNAAKSTLWASWSGFLAFISRGDSPLTRFQFISINLASPPISSRAFSKIPGTQLLRLLLTGLAYPLIQLLRRRMWMILQLNYVAQPLTKA